MPHGPRPRSALAPARHTHHSKIPGVRVEARYVRSCYPAPHATSPRSQVPARPARGGAPPEPAREPGRLAGRPVAAAAPVAAADRQSTVRRFLMALRSAGLCGTSPPWRGVRVRRSPGRRRDLRSAGESRGAPAARQQRSRSGKPVSLRTSRFDKWPQEAPRAKPAARRKFASVTGSCSARRTFSPPNGRMDDWGAPPPSRCRRSHRSRGRRQRSWRRWCTCRAAPRRAPRRSKASSRRRRPTPTSGRRCSRPRCATATSRRRAASTCAARRSSARRRRSRRRSTAAAATARPRRAARGLLLRAAPRAAATRFRRGRRRPPRSQALEPPAAPPPAPAPAADGGGGARAFRSGGGGLGRPLLVGAHAQGPKPGVGGFESGSTRRRSSSG